METELAFILYGTQACHLCETAELQLQSLLPQQAWESVDIASDDALLNEYGIRIPVLQNSVTRKELNWPFERTELAAFLAIADSHRAHDNPD